MNTDGKFKVEAYASNEDGSSTFVGKIEGEDDILYCFDNVKFVLGSDGHPLAEYDVRIRVKREGIDPESVLLERAHKILDRLIKESMND